MPAVAHGEQLRSSLATINSTKKFRCPIPLLPDPDNGIVENRRASGELPHDLPQSTRRDLHLRSAPGSVAVTVRTSRRQAWIMPLMSWPAKACSADQSSEVVESGSAGGAGKRCSGDKRCAEASRGRLSRTCNAFSPLR